MKEQNPEKIIRREFKKAKSQGYANNFSFEERCNLQKQLADDENCIVRINATDGSEYHLTSERIIHEENNPQYIHLKDITQSFWMTKDFRRRRCLIKELGDRVILETNGEDQILDYLGPSYYPLKRAIDCILKSRS